MRTTPTQFLANNLDDLLQLATAGSPEQRRWLGILLARCEGGPTADTLRQALSHSVGASGTRRLEQVPPETDRAIADFTKSEILQPMPLPECVEGSAEAPEPLTAETVLTVHLETREPLTYTEILVAHHASDQPCGEVVRVFSRKQGDARYRLEGVTLTSAPAETRLLPPRAFVYWLPGEEPQPVAIVQVQERRYGTGRELTQHLYLYDNVAWHQLEMPRFAQMFRSTLGVGESFRGQTSPETEFSSAALRAWLDIYTEGDADCCPSAGRIWACLEIGGAEVTDDDQGSSSGGIYRVEVVSFERTPPTALL